MRPRAYVPAGLGPDQATTDASVAKVSRRERRKVRIVERFSGKRVRAHPGAWRRIRSIVFILVIGAVLAAALASIGAAAFAGLSFLIHHVAKT